MSKVFKTFFLLLLLGSLSFYSLFAQEKFEKEYRIKPSEVPKKALDFIEKWNIRSVIKWYAEESNDGKSFEAKLKFKGTNYSIEFAENGTILDIEKAFQFSELSKDTQDKIEKSLSKNFQKFAIKKMQIQFTGTESEIADAFLNEQLLSKNTHYEIELKGKKQATFLMYEVLLNSNFEILKELKFSSINSLNLQF